MHTAYLSTAHVRVVAATLLAVGLLSACASSDADPTATTSQSAPTASRTATPTKTPTATATKTGLVTPDLATLAAAAKAHFEAQDQAIRTRDTTVFRRTFDVACTICASNAARLDGYTRLGQTLQGGAHRISSPSLFKAESGGGILIMSFHQDPSKLVDASGKTVTVYESSDVPRIYLQFQLIKQSWIVVGVVVG